jgi:hypothetical protein
MKKIDVVGKTFGRLTVLKELDCKITGDTVKKSKRYVYCICSCGNTVEKPFEGLRSGKVSSCGCLKKESTASINYTHGDSGSVEYKTWTKIKGRCFCKTDKKYPIYGGRGITMCYRWKNSYEAFLEDMGRRPSNKSSIDRIDVNGNYEPENCRWADNIEQSNNKRTNVVLSYREETMTLSQWAKVLSVNYKKLHKEIVYKNKTLNTFLDGRL